MLILEQQPNAISFARNPIRYRFRTEDLNGDPYGQTGVVGRIIISEITEPSLQNGETLKIDWSNAVENYSYTFVGHPIPSSQNQLQSEPHSLTAEEYMQSWLGVFQSHPVISAFFDVSFYSFGDFVGINLEDKSKNPDFTISFDHSDINQMDGSNFSVQPYQDNPLPENYSIQIDVFFQSDYNDGAWKNVATLSEIPDVNGITELDLKDIIEAEIINSFEEPDLPIVGNTTMYVANNLRRFSIRYAEYFGSPVSEENAVFADTRVAMCGGVDQSIYPNNSFLSGITEENSFLTWYPNGKTVSPDLPEFLPWYNYTGSGKNICLIIKTYDQDGVETETVLYNDSEEFLRVEANEVAIIPVGLEQLGFDDEDIRKYCIQVRNYIPPDVVQDLELYSPERCYYVDWYHYNCLKTIVYFDGFCLPVVLRLTGRTKMDLSVNRLESNAVLPSDFTNTQREVFQYDFEWENTFTFRTGYLQKKEVDALQQILIYNHSYEIENGRYVPLHITDKTFRITECLQFLHSLEFRAIQSLKSYNFSLDTFLRTDCCPGNSICIDNQIITFANDQIIIF